MTTKVFNDLPPFIKKTFLLGDENTQFARICAGLNGISRATAFKYQMGQVVELGNGSDQTISEDQSIAGATAETIARKPEYNYAQISQHKIDVSYARTSQTGGLVNIGPEGESQSPLDFQIDAKLKIVQKNWDWSAINGVAVESTASNVAYKMGGIFNICDTAQYDDTTNNVFDAGAVALTTAMINSSLATMFNKGVSLSKPAFLVNPTMKVKLSELYGQAVDSINVGGVDITTIHTDFGVYSVVMDTNVPADRVGFVDLAKCKPVILPVPNKGMDIVVEDLGKGGASDGTQIYAQIGFEFESGLAHGYLFNIA